jgi:hypothetical protein
MTVGDGPALVHLIVGQKLAVEGDGPDNAIVVNDLGAGGPIRLAVSNRQRGFAVEDTAAALIEFDNGAHCGNGPTVSAGWVLLQSSAAAFEY